MQLRVAMPHRDRSLALLCLVAFALCAALFVGIQVRSAMHLVYWEEATFFGEFFLALASALAAIAVVRLALANDRGCVTAGDVIGCVATLFIALAAFSIASDETITWLALQMDIPDLWTPRLHARTIAPLLLGGTLILLLAWRGWWVARRGAARVSGRDLERLPT
jgi:hypothetical protein